MTMRKVAKMFVAAAVLLGFSQCAAPPQTVSGRDEMSADVQTDLTAYRTDLISQLPPAYPTETHGHHYQGSGIYRVTFQYDSGQATSVAVIKTAGQGVLDQAAIEALRKWKVRARSRHSIDVTVRFVQQAHRPHFDHRIPDLRETPVFPNCLPSGLPGARTSEYPRYG